MAINFDNTIPEWKNEGIEPSEDLKQKGFVGGYKPPATVFNWFWCLVQKCITELQNKLKTHADNINNPHEVTKEQVGLGNVDNTSDVNKPVSLAVQMALDNLENKYSTNVYCECDTPADTPDKVADIVSGKFNLVAGARVFVKFINGNNTTGATLKIGDTEAKLIYRWGLAGDLPTKKDGFNNNSIHEFIYDGTNYKLLGSEYLPVNTNTGVETNGLMIIDDKIKLDGIETGANKTVVDSILNSTSTNPVQNKVISEVLNGKLDKDYTLPCYFANYITDQSFIINTDRKLEAGDLFFVIFSSDCNFGGSAQSSLSLNYNNTFLNSGLICDKDGNELDEIKSQTVYLMSYDTNHNNLILFTMLTDNVLNAASTNPVQNKVVTTRLQELESRLEILENTLN